MLANYLAYDLFIASLMKLLFTIKMVAPRGSDDNNKQEVMSNDDKLKLAYVGMDPTFDQEKPIQIHETLKKEKLKVTDSFRRLKRKIKDGVQLAESDIENIMYES